MNNPGRRHLIFFFCLSFCRLKNYTSLCYTRLYSCRLSSVGRALDWRSKGPWFKQESSYELWTIPGDGIKSFFCFSFCRLKIYTRLCYTRLYSCRLSSFERALDWRSKGPWLKPEISYELWTIPGDGISSFFCFCFCRLKNYQVYATHVFIVAVLAQLGER